MFSFLPYSLRYLFRLRLFAIVRSISKSLKTPRGIAFLLLTILIFVIWAGSLVWMSSNPDLFQSSGLSNIDELAPWSMLGACLVTILLGDEKSIRFTAAEVDFLFSGPFTRRDLMAYKIWENFIGATLAGTFFFFCLLPHLHLYIPGLIGCITAVLFLQLFQTTFVLLVKTGSEALEGFVRYIMIAFFLAISLGVISLWQSWISMEDFNGIANIILAPFKVFTNTMFATNYTPDFWIWGSVSIGLNILMISLIMNLDALYMDAALQTAQKYDQFLQRFKTGGISNIVVFGFLNQLRLPNWFPIKGAKSITWLQVNQAIRSVSIHASVSFILLSSAILIYYVQSMLKFDSKVLIIVVIAGVFQFSILLTFLIRIDFRSKLDHLDLFRSLPIKPSRIVMNTLFISILWSWGVQSTILIIAGIIMPGIWLYVVGAIIYLLPWNYTLYCFENLTFLLFPSRAISFQPGDIQGLGHQVILFFVKLIVMFIIALLVAALFWLLAAYFLLSLPIVFVSGVILLFLIGLVFQSFTVQAFKNFDPSLQIPAE